MGMPGPAARDESGSFGKRIQELRRACGLTQRQLAQQLGIDFTYLSKLENSRGDPPGDQTIRNLAQALKADEEELFALAGKVPSELRAKAAEDPEFAMLLRRLPNLSEDVLQRIYRAARRQPPSP
ncbi:MAG TPA: helix-turn-helix transcriptional regulator [Candidatus Dormibacteraeota bacterium]|nr:helix-turn-helix transcriptional regulator [Candidatus Dormibacteraeota bacterium]